MEVRKELLRKSREDLAKICEKDPTAVEICGREDFIREYEALRIFQMQFVSDIHLEFFNKNDLKRVIENFLKARGDTQFIALLGDIGDPMAVKNKFYEQIIAGLAPHYKGVFVIAGNHEYYSGFPMEEVNKRIEEICDRFHNVYFLNNRKVEVELAEGKKVIIIGATLWTHIPKESQEYVKKKINDYEKIYINDVDRLVPEDNNLLHALAVDFILDLSTNADAEVIILTHHAPLKDGTTNPKYEGDITNSAYATDLSHLFLNPIKAWCFGHTHWQVDFDFNGVKVLSNPMGYRTELKKNGQEFDFGAILSV